MLDKPVPALYPKDVVPPLTLGGFISLLVLFLNYTMRSKGGSPFLQGLGGSMKVKVRIIKGGYRVTAHPQDRRDGRVLAEKTVTDRLPLDNPQAFKNDVMAVASAGSKNFVDAAKLFHYTEEEDA